MGECLILKSGGGVDTSDGTATAAQIISGYTAYVNDNKITGTMANRGAITSSLNAGGSYTIPAGYHNGSGKVTANTLASQTSGTAAAAQILSGYTAWVGGTKLTGSMVNRGTVNYSFPANGRYTIPAGWHSGSGVVSQALPIQAGWTCTPTTSDQVVCWAGAFTSGQIWCAGDGNLVPWNVRNGVWIFGTLGTFTGWVDQGIWVIQNGNIVSDRGFSYRAYWDWKSQDVTGAHPYQQPGDGTVWLWARQRNGGADEQYDGWEWGGVWCDFPMNIAPGALGSSSGGFYYWVKIICDFQSYVKVTNNPKSGRVYSYPLVTTADGVSGYSQQWMNNVWSSYSNTTILNGGTVYMYQYVYNTAGFTQNITQYFGNILRVALNNYAQGWARVSNLWFLTYD